MQIRSIKTLVNAIESLSTEYWKVERVYYSTAPMEASFLNICLEYKHSDDGDTFTIKYNLENDKIYIQTNLFMVKLIMCQGLFTIWKI